MVTVVCLLWRAERRNQFSFWNPEVYRKWWEHSAGLRRTLLGNCVEKWRMLVCWENMVATNGRTLRFIFVFVRDLVVVLIFFFNDKSYYVAQVSLESQGWDVRCGMPCPAAIMVFTSDWLEGAWLVKRENGDAEDRTDDRVAWLWRLTDRSQRALSSAWPCGENKIQQGEPHPTFLL